MGAGSHRAETVQVGIGILLVIGSVLAPIALGSGYWAHNFLLVNLFVAVAVLQNILLADAGQASFGQGAVFGISAYTAGIVSGLWGYGFAVGALAGIAASVLLGLCFAGPALRVQGHYLGFVTLSAALVFPEMLVALNDLTNGINGIALPVAVLAHPLVGGVSGVALLIMAFTSACLVGHAWLRRLRLGRALRVAAASPEAAATLGLSAGRLRFIAFTAVAAGTGVAGVLYVPVLGFVSPYAFRVDLSIFFFFSVVIGGQGRILGPVLGTWLLYLVPNALLVDLAIYRLLGYGIIALLIMLAFPDGLVGSVENALRRYRLRQRIEDVSVAPVLATDAPVQRAEPSATPVIVLTAARKTYGRMVALDDVSLAVAPGRIHGLVGPNGSGKTTLLNVISGLIRLNGGSIAIKGTDTTRRPAHAIARLGVGRTFQTPRVFEDMSIWDNLRIGDDATGAAHESWLLATLHRQRADWEQQLPDLVPHAQRRLLEVMRVVATEADILLLDEPAAGLSPEERRSFVALLRLLRDRLGKTIVLIEHDLKLVWQVADRISVLDAGRIVADGAPDAIMADARVRALFTGAARA